MGWTIRSSIRGKGQGFFCKKSSVPSRLFVGYIHTQQVEFFITIMGLVFQKVGRYCCATLTRETILTGRLLLETQLNTFSDVIMFTFQKNLSSIEFFAENLFILLFNLGTHGMGEKTSKRVLKTRRDNGVFNAYISHKLTYSA